MSFETIIFISLLCNVYGDLYCFYDLFDYAYPVIYILFLVLFYIHHDRMGFIIIRLQIIIFLLLLISVVWIKNECEDIAFDVKIEPAMNALHGKEDSINALIVEKQNQVIGPTDCMDELFINEEPPEDKVSNSEIKFCIIVALQEIAY